jgi:FkbM family methyltransferase
MLINFTNLKEKYNVNITGIIHIGGHFGEELSDYVSTGIQNIVVFEPLKSNFNILSENVNNLNSAIITHQVALGPEEKEVEMFVSSNDGVSSSVLKPKVHLTQYNWITFDQIEKVKMKTLDSYNYTNYNFINMDVQGYELEVLKGASETLNHIDYVYCEVNRDEVYENNAYVEEIDEFLFSYNMERVETSWDGGTWGDAFYIRKK